MAPTPSGVRTTASGTPLITADEANAARRLGGLRRKREKTVAGAFDVTGLASVEIMSGACWRWRCSTHSGSTTHSPSQGAFTAAGAVARLLEMGELQARIAAHEVVEPLGTVPVDKASEVGADRIDALASTAADAFMSYG